ncbi:MAG: Lsr2 family protein [Nocardioidaceae bacterium]|nr:Lsr2 family protein [Nocardioidaceae bacterium]
MAQKVQIILVDDVDGGEADETVRFGLDGTSYEIDLSRKNAQALRDTFARYVAEGRKVGNRRSASGRRSSSTTTSGDSPAQIREWARNNGFNVPARGRVSAEVREAYAAAH